MARAKTGARLRFRSAALGKAEGHRGTGDQAAQQSGDPQSMFPAHHLNQHVAGKIETGDQYHHQPGLVRIDDLEPLRAEVCIRHQWQHDQGDDCELERCLDIRGFDSLGQIMQPAFHRQQQHRNHCDGAGNCHLIPGAQTADQESDQNRDLSRGPDIAVLRRHLISRDYQCDNRQKHQSEDPGQSRLLPCIHRGRTEQRHQGEGSYTGKGAFLAAGTLALQSDKHAQPEGGAELPCRVDFHHLARSPHVSFRSICTRIWNFARMENIQHC